MTRPLVENVVAYGRRVDVTTYHDGPSSPIRASLLFRTQEDAEACARLFREAKAPGRVEVGTTVRCTVPNVGPWTLPVKRIEGDGKVVVVEFLYADGMQELKFSPSEVEVIS